MHRDLRLVSMAHNIVHVCFGFVEQWLTNYGMDAIGCMCTWTLVVIRGNVVPLGIRWVTWLLNAIIYSHFLPFFLSDSDSIQAREVLSWLFQNIFND